MSEASAQAAKTRIREAGLRATAPRVAVYCLLETSKRPMSHTQVVEELDSPDWDQATVYRNLRKLVEVKLARIATRLDGVDRYELRREAGDHPKHPHFSCRTCGTVECLPEATVVGLVGHRWQRALESCELQLTGQCPDCLDKELAGE